ncbi:MAG: MerR family transcriptional regulator [Cyclobacteriaceae bacterium]|jgi:MerR family transcriptional regulator, light-induced transcriptional regulator|nr:MerR family transcriptional regulator [Cyclobacteriaceae bacterium]
MGNYSIKELESLSGIKAHTIRIWEKRHQLIAPQRTSTNIRYYSDRDLKKIINVSLLNNKGIKISTIAGMSLDELNAKVVELSHGQHETSIFIDQLIVGMVDMDEEQFEKQLGHLIMKFGFEKTITDIVYPFLEKIGILWQTGNITPAQEHFISNLIRQKIIVAIDSLPFPPKGADKIVLFLPEDELHEIGLLFFHYIVRRAGYRTFYLGQHLPYSDLKQVCEKHKPNYLITSISVLQRAEDLKEYFAKLVQEFPNTILFISGKQGEQVMPKGKNVRTFTTAESLLAQIQQK